MTEKIKFHHVDPATFVESDVEIDKIQHDIATDIINLLNNYNAELSITPIIALPEDDALAIGIMAGKSGEERQKYKIVISNRHFVNRK